MNWGTIKLIALQKAFLQTSNTIDTVANEDYLNRMWAIANECIVRIATVIKPTINKITVNAFRVENLVANTSRVVDYGTLTFNEEGKSFYFEVAGSVSWAITYTKNGTPTVVNGTSTTDVYTVVSDSYDCDSISIVFTSDYPYKVRNVAIYPVRFPSGKVQRYGSDVKFDLKALANDFHYLQPNNVVKLNDDGTTETFSDYRIDKGSIVVFPYWVDGSFEIYYNAYPVVLASDTADNTEIALDIDLAMLLPTYIASQLLKEDEMQLSVQYLNEFENGLERIIYNSKSGTAQVVWIGE
jgi:hypothetical protein